MNCNCIQETEEKLFDFYKNKRGLGDKLESVKCTATGMRLTGNKLITTINIPFSVKADKTGFRSKKGAEIPFIASFCPFCGISTSIKETEEA